MTFFIVHSNCSQLHVVVYKNKGYPLEERMECYMNLNKQWCTVKKIKDKFEIFIRVDLLLGAGYSKLKINNCNMMMIVEKYTRVYETYITKYNVIFNIEELLGNEIECKIPSGHISLKVENTFFYTNIYDKQILHLNGEWTVTCNDSLELRNVTKKSFIIVNKWNEIRERENDMSIMKDERFKILKQLDKEFNEELFENVKDITLLINNHIKKIEELSGVFENTDELNIPSNQPIDYENICFVWHPNKNGTTFYF